MKPAIIIGVLLSGVTFTTPTIAARCPHGQILRVSMHKCVSVYSALAKGYVHTLPRKRIVLALHKPSPSPLINDGVYYLSLENAEMLRERLARPRMALNREAILLSLASALTP